VERPKALIVEDDESFRTSLEGLVRSEGFEVRGARTLEEAREALDDVPPDLLLIDLVMPDGNGLELLRARGAGDADGIVVTGYPSVDSAVEALRVGARDYLTKPLDTERLRAVLARVLRAREADRELVVGDEPARERDRLGSLVGASEAMQRVYDAIERVAATDASVLISGQSGTGKELTARTIHRLSMRRKGPFLALNCGAVSTHLIESELFGHERGSFTGADRTRRGYFEQAAGGTLFLDEIAEMPRELQVRLLRVLETASVTRVGGSEAVPVDVRVIAATNRPVREAVAEGKLRGDLYYRLSVFPLELPPLRERPGDAELLADHFLAERNREAGTRKRFSAAARAQLAAEAWPGNVRELANAVRRAFILSGDEIPAELLPRGEGRGLEVGGTSFQVRVGDSIDEVERRLILATLRETGGDKRRSAEILGISLRTLYNRLSVYDAGRLRSD
jgi:DNA-binding NtrC family response regulator